MGLKYGAVSSQLPFNTLVWGSLKLAPTNNDTSGPKPYIDKLREVTDSLKASGLV